MAEITPPSFLQNAGATHNAQITRLAANAGLAGVRAAGELNALGGVRRALGTGLALSAPGGMVIRVGSGVADVPGTLSGVQGVYSCTNDADKDVTLTASHATLNRTDLIVARVYDSVYSGSTNTWALEKVDGVAGSGAPAAPDNSLVLGTVFIGAGVSTPGTITPVAPYLGLGIFAFKDAAHRGNFTSSRMPDGCFGYQEDNDTLYIMQAGVWQRLRSDATSDNLFTSELKCRAYRNAALSINSATWTLIPLDAEEMDVGGLHSTSSTTSRINLLTAGTWEIEAGIRFPIDSRGERGLNLRKNSGGSVSGGTILKQPFWTSQPTAPMELEVQYKGVFAAGDYVEMFGWQNTTVSMSLDVGTTERTFLYARRLGPAW